MKITGLFIILFSLVFGVFLYLENPDRKPSSNDFRGVDYQNTHCGLSFKCWYIKMKFPKFLDSTRAELKAKRTSLLEELSSELDSAAINVTQVQALLDNLRKIEEAWDQHLDPIEIKAAQSYDKSVNAEKVQKGIVRDDDFTVSPFLLYAGEYKRILRWVVSTSFQSTIIVKGPEHNERTFIVPKNDRTPYKEMVLNDLTVGRWTYEIKIQSEQTEKIATGNFIIGKVSSLLYFADTQDSLKRTEKALKRIKELSSKEQIDIIIHGGDINSWGSNEEEMLEAARLISNLDIPLLFIKGNHEFFDSYGYDNKADFYYKLFALDSDFGLYSFGAKDQFQLMSWDTNFYRMTTNDFIKQDQLLKKALQENTNRPLILVGHQGYFSKGWHGSTLGSQSDDWIEALYLDKVFRTTNLTLTLSAHDHVYQRIVDTKGTFPTQHIVAGAAAAELLFPYFETQGEVKKILRKRTATIIKANDEKIQIRSLDLTNKKVLDQVEIP